MLLMKFSIKILPLLQGEYRTIFERVYTCKSKNTFQANLYFSKRTSNITEMKGNFTLLKRLDDDYTVSIIYFNNDCNNNSVYIVFNKVGPLI